LEYKVFDIFDAGCNHEVDIFLLIYSAYKFLNITSVYCIQLCCLCNCHSDCWDTT